MGYGENKVKATKYFYNNNSRKTIKKIKQTRKNSREKGKIESKTSKCKVNGICTDDGALQRRRMRGTWAPFFARGEVWSRGQRETKSAYDGKCEGTLTVHC